MCHQPHEGSVNIKQPQACQTGFQARAARRPELTAIKQALPAVTVLSLAGCAWAGSVADGALFTC